jgi:hypothetical protein
MTPLQHAKDLVWQNLPSGASTFSTCRCGRGAGRGGGPCIFCAHDHLRGIVGIALASDYVHTVQRLRELEARMEEKVRP